MTYLNLSQLISTYPNYLNLSNILIYMEIPNYDSGDKSNNGFKQLHKYMPKNTFRMLLAGNSASGKTNLLSHILQCPLIYYDQIHLYAKNLDQDKYMSLIDKMNGISEQVGYPVLMTSNDEIIPVDQPVRQ